MSCLSGPQPTVDPQWILKDPQLGAYNLAGELKKGSHVEFSGAHLHPSPNQCFV